MGVVCDGVSEVRRAARHQLRTGADHIKLMLSGGVASPTDRVDSTQFSDEEIRAAVEEAEAANRYALGHAYTARAINRGLKLGVRSIEHGNLLDEESVRLFREFDAFLVPTLVTYERLKAEGAAHGLPQESQDKVENVLHAGIEALRLADEGGVNIAYGSDLLGGMRGWQSHEFASGLACSLLARSCAPPPPPLPSCCVVRTSERSQRVPRPTSSCSSAIPWKMSAC